MPYSFKEESKGISKECEGTESIISSKAKEEETCEEGKVEGRKEEIECLKGKIISINITFLEINN